MGPPWPGGRDASLHTRTGSNNFAPLIGGMAQRLKGDCGTGDPLSGRSGDRALERRGVGRCEVGGFLVHANLLVVPGVGVDGPDVVAGVVAEVLDRAGGREHRVVEVVVAVQAVAADLLKPVDP